MLLKLKQYTVVLLLVVLIGFFCFTVEGFASWSNLFNLLRQAAILGIVSVGMSFIVITGNIDLSVGALISLSSCATALLITQAGVSPVLACLIGVALSTAAMLLNGVIILVTHMPAMLCTLAAMQIYQGLAYIITRSAPVRGLPESMRLLGQGYLGPVPVPVVIMLAVFVLGQLFLSYTYPGRQLYAVGSNPESSRLAGLSVGRVSLLAFGLCGVLVGLAACIHMSRLFGGFPASTGLEMEVVTAVVVGGVSFSGGKGSVSGVFFGVLLMGVLSNGLGIMGASTNTQLVFKGLVLILVVGLDCYQASHPTKAAALKKEGKHL